MDQRQQPGRVAKRKSDDVEFEDDHYDEMDDLQERLDRILGSDSGAESEYTPDKDSQTEDGEEVCKETKTKTDEKIVDEEEDLMSDDSEIEKMKEDQRKRLQELINDRAPKPNQFEMKTPSPSPNRKSKKSEKHILSFEDLRSVPTLVKECFDPLQRNILFLAEKKAEATAAGKGFETKFTEKTHTEDIKKHLRKLMVEDPAECCATLIELMKQPKDLFVHNNSTRGLHHNYEMEALGKIALELIQRMLKNKTLQMENVLRVGLCGRNWRNAANFWKGGNVRTLGAWKRIPFTMTGAARRLLEGGDIARLSELFEVKSELFQEEGER